MSGKNKAFKIFFILAAFLLIAASLFAVLLRPSALFSSIPRATTTSFGHAGDPINIALIGDKSTIVNAFLSAQWVAPDPITASSTAKIIEASIMNAAYPSAPVSNIYFFGRVQDLAFELPTDTVRQRHHLRLWKTDKTVAGKPLWVGSATYDSGLELSGTTALPTHHIAPNVDADRDLVARSLKNTGLVAGEVSERIGYPTLWSFNGGGDWYFDDGLVRMLTVQ